MQDKNNVVWFALFSQTGSELDTICTQLGRWPDAVITNNKNADITRWRAQCKHIIALDSNKGAKLADEFYCNLFEMLLSIMNVSKDDATVLITLHGWLKIIPPITCERYAIFNGHPGDIIKYPELKGKDPQKKAFDLKLPTSGCVIHRVTKDVDGGSIVKHGEVSIKNCKTENDVINVLKKQSIIQWKEFINRLYSSYDY